ncbi:MAG TPA: lipid-binding SYLF domain-containing protein [Syntrophales bacterium]|nr:lipid-binding SYLF domain-containing protein [Syntrophales bacterium]
MRKLLWSFILLVAFSMIFAGALFTTKPAIADDKMEARQLVEQARLSWESLMKDDLMGIMRDTLKDAKGIFIIPQLLQGAFIVGASGGSGVFLQRDGGNKWTGPAFYTVGGASIGFQIGGEASEVVLLAMTDRGVAAFQSNNFKLGADAGVALGPIGAGISAQTANLSADILSFSRPKGLYGGVSLQGAVVATRDGWNRAYYGKNVKPSDILIRPTVSSSQASRLLEEVAKAAAKK